jgi:8-oxo-dGTP pyrophosphatase MutT (NUDIX family)
MNADMRDLLIRELSEYRPADLNEREHVWRTLELLHLRGAVASRHHFGPGHITASAFIVDPASQKLLLHHHRRLDRWLQMGGHLDHGESPREAAIREAREESGLENITPALDEIFDVDVHTIPSGKSEPDHIHYDLRFLFHADVADALKRADEESLDLKWFGYDEAEQAMNEEASSRVLRKIRARA